MHQIGFANFPVISREDEITVTRPPEANPNETSYALNNGANVTSWKGIELYSAQGRKIRSATVEGSPRSSFFSIPKSELTGCRLVFAKAKMFGIHMGMYELHNLEQFSGHDIQFDWTIDIIIQVT